MPGRALPVYRDPDRENGASTPRHSLIENLQANKVGVVLAALNLAHGLMDLRTLLQSPSLPQAEGEQLARIIECFRRLATSRGQISTVLEGIHGAAFRQESRLTLCRLKAAFAALEGLPGRPD